MKPLPLGGLSLETFLTEYWQKKPLYIPNGLPGVTPPLSGEELAGLACEEDVESRLIIQDGKSDSWELHHGPFPEERFRTLPERHWTLLVQAVDHWVPDAAAFLESFYFIPSWRIDDLMMSYSSLHGGVGPHYDNYDVFLVQVQGLRKWEIGGLCDDATPRRPDTPVTILSDWHPHESFTLEPGDVLYVPPLVGHNGIAMEDGCLTCSVGFRAPSHGEILREFSTAIGECVSEAIRYADPDLSPQSNPGEISSEALEQVHRILRQYVDDRPKVSCWFGQFMTSPKYPEFEHATPASDAENFRRRLEEGKALFRNEGSRFAFYERDDERWFFVDGRTYSWDAEQGSLIQQLCGQRTLNPATFANSEANLELLQDLVHHGSLYFPDESSEH